MRCRFLFQADLGDPISSIFVNELGCMAGSMLGKVLLYSFQEHQVEILSAFSDEGVRGLYLDQDVAFATLTDACKGWQRTPPHMHVSSLNFRSLDKKNTQSVRSVLQRGSSACVLFPISSTVVNIPKQEHHLRALKLFDFGSASEVAPCDWDGETLLIVDRSRVPGPPIFRLVQLERNEYMEVQNLPEANRVTLVKIWGHNCLACVVESTLFIYDFKRQEIKVTMKGHSTEIVAVDAQDPEILATLAKDASVKLWNGRTGACLQTVKIPEASYFLGYPYHLSVCGHRVLASADEGVFLVELDQSPEAP